MINNFNDQILNMCSRDKICTTVTCVRYNFNTEDIIFRFMFYPCEETPGVWFMVTFFHDGYITETRHINTLLGLLTIDVDQTDNNLEKSYNSTVYTGVNS